MSEWEVPFVFGAAPVQVIFTVGTKLRADYWRLMQGGKTLISSFDHKQQYGLPKPLDAIEELRKVLSEKVVTSGKIDRDTGDLHFEFSENVSLHIFNVSGYEVWEVNFPDGTCEYSNYNR